jgi:hypothetical protein
MLDAWWPRPVTDEVGEATAGAPSENSTNSVDYSDRGD